MDEAFKFTYVACAFSALPRLLHGWRNQIKFLDSVWDRLEQMFDKHTFMSLLTSQCRELSLPLDTYDIDAAFKRATTTWRIDYMLAVAEKVVVFQVEDIHYSATDIVEWNEKDRKFLIKVSKIIAQMESRKQSLERSLLVLNEYLK